MREMIEQLEQAGSLLLAAAVLLILVSIVYASWRNGISPMPSSEPVRRAVAAEVNRIPGGGTLVEAGSGWGTLALHLARHCPGWRIIGIENSPVPWWSSRVLAWLAGRFGPGTRGKRTAQDVIFLRQDLYDYPYGEAGLIVCYLFPGAMQRLSTIMESRLAPQARILSIYFALPGWQAERVVTCSDLHRTRIYIYSAAGRPQGDHRLQ